MRETFDVVSHFEGYGHRIIIKRLYFISTVCLASFVLFLNQLGFYVKYSYTSQITSAPTFACENFHTRQTSSRHTSYFDLDKG